MFFMNCLIQKIHLQNAFELSGLPRQARFCPCLDFGFQYALIRNKWSKKIRGRILDLASLKFAMAALFIIMRCLLHDVLCDMFLYLS